MEGKIGENRLTYTVEDAKDADGVEIPSSEIKEKLLHISDAVSYTHLVSEERLCSGIIPANWSW